MITTIEGKLEIHHERGVIYFHASDPNWIREHGVVTPLRICSLTRPIPQVEQRMLDITHMDGTDWDGTVLPGYEEQA